jgi:hypothetical protein
MSTLPLKSPSEANFRFARDSEVSSPSHLSDKPTIQVNSAHLSVSDSAIMRSLSRARDRRTEAPFAGTEPESVTEWSNNSPGTMRMLFPGRASTVRLVGALSDLDDITVRITDVAADLAVLWDWRRDELGSSTLP